MTSDASAVEPDSSLPGETAEELYEHAPFGYLSTLPDGTIVRINHTLLSWTGYQADDVVGERRFVDLLSAGGRIYHETHYAPLLVMQGAVRAVALDLVCSDGRLLTTLVSANLVRTSEGDPKVIRIGVFDVADRREYERELVRARRRAEESEARARRLAATLQASLIPPDPPVIPGLNVAAAYRPAGAGDEVGGDFYDVFQTADDDWGILLGDVSGKGAEAATVTALARHTVRAAAMRSRSPSEVLETLNAALLDHPTGRFCTAVYLLTRRTGLEHISVTFASAGHPLPFHLSRAGIRAVGTAGALLGVMDDPPLHDDTMDLEPGEALFCYTDGLTEGRRGRDFFGEERLVETLSSVAERPADVIVKTVVDEALAFQGGRGSDDIAAVLISVPAACHD